MTETGKRVMAAIGLGGIGSFATVLFFVLITLLAQFSPLGFLFRTPTNLLPFFISAFIALWITHGILAFIALQGVDAA